jgi:PAS domain S-box-containing protein
MEKPEEVRPGDSGRLVECTSDTAEEWHRRMFQQSVLGMAVSDNTFHFVMANPAFCEMLGYTEAELSNLTFKDITHPSHLAKDSESIQKLALGEILSYKTEKRYVTKSGEVVYGAVTVTALHDATGKHGHSLVVLENITRRKQLEDAVNQTAKLESLGVLAGGIAHDFNNLLAGIFGYVDLALAGTKEEKTAHYLKSTIASMGRAKALTYQLLTFAKGGSPIQKVTPLISFIRETTQFALSGSNVSCRFSLDQDLWPCNIDKNQIGQVIDNIVINAQQAMPSGGTIEITAVNISFGEKEHHPLSKGDYVKVSVKDSGIGIPKDIVPRIFDPFYTTKQKGHGLGLATCYSIINRHGGCIDVESEPGKGSMFHVYLPASMDGVVALAPTTARHKGIGTIVVMDDEEVVRDIAREMLESMGYTVVCKSDGREAVDFFINETGAKRHCVAMIFDLTIPGGMGGVEAVKEIRKVNKEIPVFVASGYAGNSVMKDPVQNGFVASISKPFTIAELSELLHTHLKPSKEHHD